MSASSGRDDVHISSFVVQHREDAMPALAAMVASHPDLELAVRGAVRSVVLCESSDGHVALDRVDQLQTVPGVLNVLLVYHHAEPPHALDEPLSKGTESGVPA